jgi:DNA-binding transcriptional ArsR family regulator
MGEEDPYSQIFSSLKHPTRRLILRSLSQGQPRRFSQLQGEIGVDSPTLSYHLEALEGLVEKQGDLYKLTELGSASYNLMRRVEEPPQPVLVTPRRDRIRLGIAWTMVLILLVAGLFGILWTFPASPILNSYYTTIPYTIAPNSSTYFFVGLKYASNIGSGAQNGIWPAQIPRPNWTPWAWTVNYALFYPTFNNGTVLMWLTGPNGQRAPNQQLACNPLCDQYAPDEISTPGGSGTDTVYTMMTTEGEYSLHLQNIGQGLATGKVQLGPSTVGYYRPGFFVGLVFLIPSLTFTTYSAYHILKPRVKSRRMHSEKLFRNRTNVYPRPNGMDSHNSSVTMIAPNPIRV